MNYSRPYHKKRRAAGGCVDCMGVAALGKSRCSICAEKHREREQIRYENDKKKEKARILSIPAIEGPETRKWILGIEKGDENGR